MSLLSFLKHSTQIQSLGAAEFKRVISDENVQLVDVRTPEEYRQGTIENAQLIDLYSRDFSQNIDAKLDKTRPVAIFCHSGARSLHAAQILAGKGFSEIYNLKDGIISLF